MKSKNLYIYKGGEGNTDFRCTNPSAYNYICSPGGGLAHKYITNIPKIIVNDKSDVDPPITSTGGPGGSIIYPVYGYKPSQIISGKSTLFMRSTGNITWSSQYSAPDDPVPVSFGTDPINITPKSFNWSSSNMNITPFSNNLWSYNDLTKVSATMTNGKELFLVKTTTIRGGIKLNSGFTLGTLDQLYYSYSKGMNNGIIGYLEGNYVQLFNDANPNPSGYNITFLSNTNMCIDLLANGYVLNFDQMDYLSSCAGSQYSVLADNYVNSTMIYNYVYVWGIKPDQKDFAKISPSVTSIEPFMIKQNGNIWSMYDF